MKKTYRAKLEKLQDEPGIGEAFLPTTDDIRKWFRILNRELFANVFTAVPDIDIRRRRMAWAYFEYQYDTIRTDYVWTRLLMNNKYRSKLHFVEVLAHEMVHLYQVLHNNPPGHGPSFHEWKEHFNEKGLRLLELGYET